LKSLSGVGPAMEKRMIALGVTNIDELKGLSEDKIATMTAEDAKISADQWGKWIEEAKSL
jgi:large subunit ribosomal protein L21